MIFKTLFTPGHKHSDPEKRKTSIEKLDPSKESDKRVLHELAFNDASDAVSLVALAKLDSFVLWIKSLETSPSASIKKKAEEVCLRALEDTKQVNDDLFASFVSESKNKSFLETLLFSSKRLQLDTQLSMQVLWGLGNQQTTRRFYANNASESQQLEIVNKTIDAKVLAKLSKQTSHESVISLIQSKANEAELAKLMPAKVKHTVTLINSRLLALKDTQDYAYLDESFTQLTTQFEKAKADFIYLDEITRAQLSEKYLLLKATLAEKLAVLAEQYKGQLALNKTTNDLSDIQERLTQVGQQVDLLLSSDDAEIDSQVKILDVSVKSAQEELTLLAGAAKSSAHKQLYKQLQFKIQTMQESLQNLPTVISISMQAQQLIQALDSILSPVNEKDKLSPDELAEFEAQIKRQKEAFDKLKSQNRLLPSSKVKSFAQALTRANKQINGFKDYYRNIERKCEGKLKMVDRMIADGKFKPAMSTFFNVQKLINNLPDTSKSSVNTRLSKAYANTGEAIQKLQDWQAYIAQPRKPALLEEATKLAGAAMKDAYVRVESVKQLRTQWQSFGLLHTPEDDALNKSFDEVIEKAFAPCRVFFAELEKRREDNLKRLQGIIEEASLINDETPVTELVALIGGLKSRFNKVDEIDKATHSKVKRRFYKVLDPLNKRVNNFYEENALNKQKLINKAIQFTSLDDTLEVLREATEEAKTLQQKWKAIGFAGKDKENPLWQAFREANDQLFMRYHNLMSASQAQNNEVVKKIEQNIVQIQKRVMSAAAKSDLSFYAEAVQVLEQSIETLDDKSKLKISRKLKTLEDTYQHSSQKLDVSKANTDMQNLFDYLMSTNTEIVEQAKANTNATTLDSLANRYKVWLKGDVNSVEVLQGLSRNDLVQVALIISNDKVKALDFGDENRRKELQMQLMAAKLGGGEQVSLESVLASWVAQKAVKIDEVDGLKVLQEIFLTRTL